MTEGIPAQETRPPGSGGGDVLDYAELLERCMGKAALAGAVMNAFLAQAQADVEGMCRAAAASDAETVQHLGHRLKGGAANIGAAALQRQAAELERMGREGKLEGSVAGAENLCREFQRLRAACSASVPGGGA
jgi:HPt (histidine-containing phosphotransfer) domain-containing protein